MEYADIFRNLLFRCLQKETRLSDRQLMQLRWSQIDGDVIKTVYGREVRVSRETLSALESMDREKSKYVFLCPALPSLNQAKAKRKIRLPHIPKPHVQISFS